MKNELNDSLKIDFTKKEAAKVTIKNVFGEEAW